MGVGEDRGRLPSAHHRPGSQWGREEGQQGWGSDCECREQGGGAQVNLMYIEKEQVGHEEVYGPRIMKTT